MKRHERYLHPNQIRTTRKVLLYELRDKGHRAMIACTHEQGFISEYAYAIDYVISHDGDIERPVMDGGLFPRNYSDYRYQEGIAAEVMRYEVEFWD